MMAFVRAAQPSGTGRPVFLDATEPHLHTFPSPFYLGGFCCPQSFVLQLKRLSNITWQYDRSVCTAFFPWPYGIHLWACRRCRRGQHVSLSYKFPWWILYGEVYLVNSTGFHGIPRYSPLNKRCRLHAAFSYEYPWNSPQDSPLSKRCHSLHPAFSYEFLWWIPWDSPLSKRRRHGPDSAFSYEFPQLSWRTAPTSDKNST